MISRQAKERLKVLTDQLKSQPSGSRLIVYFFIEIEAQDEFHPLRREEIAGYWIRENCLFSQPVNVTNTPPIHLPGQKMLLYCVSGNAVFLSEALQQESFADAYRGESWDELFRRNYEYWEYAFQAQATRRTLQNDKAGYYRGNFAELVPGDKFEACYAPGVFQGGPPSKELILTTEQRELYLPKPPVSDDSIKSVDPANFHYFLVNCFGVDLDGSSHFISKSGLQWWPSCCFPADSIVLDNLTPVGSFLETQTFTGVLLVPKNQEGTTHKEELKSLQDAQVVARRIRTLLNIISNAKMRILGDVSLVRSGRGGHLSKRMVNLEGLYTYRYWDGEICSQACYPSALLDTAIDLATATPPKKQLLSLLQRALDSLDLARSHSADRSISLVLIWAAIETLISPSNKSELAANLTLHLMGLQKDVNKAIFWDAVKGSYAMRSDIVHAFDLPEEMALEDSIRFTENQCVKLMQYVIQEALPSGMMKDEMTKGLRNKALSS
jgi:hypothetical protein